MFNQRLAPCVQHPPAEAATEPADPSESNTCDFAGFCFPGRADFSRAHFGVDAWFNAVRFADDADFFEATFEREGNFERGQFDGPVRFDRTRWAGSAQFRQARFTRGVSFRDARLDRDAWFVETEFAGSTSFAATQFAGEAGFGRCVWRGEANFSLARFNGNGGFEHRIVEGVLWLRSQSAMLGYLNAPSPFNEEGWFNTQDVVEVEGDYVRIIGRKSELINVGGEKVHPTEIAFDIYTAERALEVWPADQPKPPRPQLMALAHQLAEDGVLARTGEGKHGSPFVLHRPAAIPLALPSL